MREHEIIVTPKYGRVLLVRAATRSGVVHGIVFHRATRSDEVAVWLKDGGSRISIHGDGSGGLCATESQISCLICLTGRYV